MGKKKKKARPIITDVGAVQIGGGRATSSNTVVSRSFAEVVDLISEGTIEGLVSGKYAYEGQENKTGYKRIEFTHYKATGIDGDAGSDNQKESLGFLQSVYWNEVPVVDSDGFYNFPAINLQYVKGNPAGNIPKLNPDMSFYAGILVDEELDLTVNRSIGERLYGPEIQGGESAPTTEKIARLKTGTKIDKYAKTYSILNKEVSKIEVNIKIPALFESIQAGPKTYKKSKRLSRFGGSAVGYGDTKARTIEYEIYYRPLFDQRFSDTSVVKSTGTKNKSSEPPTWKRGKTEKVTGKIDTPYIRRSIISLTGKNYQDQDGFEGWEIRIVRITPESLTSFLKNVSFVDSIVEVYGTRLRYPYSSMVYSQFDARSFTRIPSRSYDARLIKVKVPNNYDPITKTYGRSDGTTQLTKTGSPDWTPANAPTKKINCATVDGSFWDGEFKKDTNTYGAIPEGAYLREWTDNPAWCFYDLLSNPRYGLGEFIEESQIDKWTLYEIAQYCDLLVPDTYGSLEPNFTINYIIMSREEAFKVLNDLTSIFRGLAYYSNGSIYAIQDKYKTAIYQFNNSNVIDGNFTYQSSSQKARHTVAIVRYNDKKNLFQPTIEYLEDEEAVRRYGIREIETTALGCTSRGQARRFAKWILASESQETETVSFSVGQDGSYLMPGDIVQIYDNFRSPLKYSGRTNAVRPLTENGVMGSLPGSNTVNSIILDQGLNFTSNKLYKFSLLTPTYNTTTGDASDIRRGQLQNLLFSGAHVNTLTGDYRSDLMESGSGICTQIYFSTGDPFGGTGNQLDFDNYVITGYTNTGVNVYGNSPDQALNFPYSESYSGGCYSGENLIWSVEPNDPDDPEFISGSYSNFRIINIKEEEKTYGISALAYSTGKYDEILTSAALSSAEKVNQPLFPTGKTKASTNIPYLPNNTTDGTNPTFTVKPGSPYPENIYKSIEIDFSQAGFEVESVEDSFKVVNPMRGGSAKTDQQSSDLEIYDIDYTIGMTTEDLGLDIQSLAKYGLSGSEKDLVYIVSPTKFKEYKNFTVDVVNYSNETHILPKYKKTPAESRVFTEYLITNTESLDVDEQFYWVSLFATSITNDVSYGMVTKIKVKGLQSVVNSIIGSSEIRNLTTSDISTTSETDLHPITEANPVFGWEFSTSNVLNTDPDNITVPNFPVKIPNNVVDYRITLRKPKDVDPNSPSSFIYVEVTGYANPSLSPFFNVDPMYIDPNKLLEYRADPQVWGWKNGKVIDAEHPPSLESKSPDNADWLSVSGSGFNIRNNDSYFPPRSYDLVVEVHDKEGKTSTNNLVFANTIKDDGGETYDVASYNTEVYLKYNFVDNEPLSYDILGVKIPSPSGIIFVQTAQDKYRTELGNYSFIDSSIAYDKKFPYVAKAAIYPNGYLELQISMAQSYEGLSNITEEQLDDFFSTAEGVVYYYSTGDNTQDYKGDKSVPLNVAPKFTLNLDADTVNTIHNTGIVSAVDNEGLAFGGIVKTELNDETPYAGKIHRRYFLFDEEQDPFNLKFHFPLIGTSRVANIELAIGMFDELSLTSSFDEDGTTPKKYSTTNESNTQLTPYIYKDFNINFSKTTEPQLGVTYDDITNPDLNNGKFLSPASFPLNEVGIMSKSQQAKAWAGWAHIILDFNGIDLTEAFRKVGFYLKAEDADPAEKSNWELPSESDGAQYNNYYKNNLDYYDPKLSNLYVENVKEEHFRLRILQDIELKVGLRVYPGWSMQKTKGDAQYGIRPKWLIEPTITLYSPAGEVDKTIVVGFSDLYGSSVSDHESANISSHRQLNSNYIYRIDEETGQISLKGFPKEIASSYPTSRIDHPGGGIVTFRVEGNSMFELIQNMMVKDGGLIVHHKPQAFSFGILQQE